MMASRSLTLSDRSQKTAAVVATGLAVTTGALILWLIGSLLVAAGFVAAAVIVLGATALWRLLTPVRQDDHLAIDWDFARTLVQTSRDAVAITDRAGHMVCANDAYEKVFGGFITPPDMASGDDERSALGSAGRAAWQDGAADYAGFTISDRRFDVGVSRGGSTAEMLVWRFRSIRSRDAVVDVSDLLAGATGDRIGASGIMAALITADGRVLGANRVLALRACGRPDDDITGVNFLDLVTVDARGLVHFMREGPEAVPLRIVQVPFADTEDAPILIALLDEGEDLPVALDSTVSEHVGSLISLIPFGMALVDRDGRFLQMNKAFGQAASVDANAPPLYPGDLVVREDKAAVADAIRRFAGGATHSSDIAVRLKDHPDEPVALTIAGARGFGDAAVLLSLKNNSEETRLQREVRQATKMQAVGQLAGGVAHDFNNILTAIIGYCDLMLMRHSPGDSDYDDIQQVRINSHRAASLTRQLLAFSRQQTMRPQILQLPDLVSEVSNLLKRLLGETISLDVTHGRNLGAVRADPGQLEQVVVNLAVNARDAIVSAHPRGGGVLTIQTLSLSAKEVRQMQHELLPITDYTVLNVGDNGTGIPSEIINKIFEPFFTTKEPGKGTGLGLSTVYGIVKQSGGWIFADSKPGEGTIFSMYLPVHAAAAVPLPASVRQVASPAELWGTGMILLVEDEDMVRAVAERALTRQGYGVLTAENGEVALELLEKHGRPDLLITDVVMPTMDGPTMVRHARERYPDLPILFMSGYAEEQLRKSIDLDHVAFLPKPFSVQQLAAAASELLHLV